jgi:hypothetical protein
VKICRDCEFFKNAAVDMGKGLEMMAVCTNDECRDPVDGSPMPAIVARKEQVFCGIQAKYFKLKVEKPAGPVIAMK